MREIRADSITGLVAELCVKANNQLPGPLKSLIKAARDKEKSDIGRHVLDMIIENFEIAGEEGCPICQDTGMAVVFAEVGQEAHITGGGFEEAIQEGVRRGYVDGLLRLSVVSDPLRRKNTNDNTPAVIHTRILPGDGLKITVCPKGFGSENMSALKMFTPSATPEDISRFIVDTVSVAGSNPCPPVIVGVGIGGTAEECMLAAKRSLLRNAGEPNPDPFYAALEKKTLEGINRLGIGPNGLGGTVTALAVHMEPLPTHIAGLPCAVNMSCHVTRHASGEL